MVEDELYLALNLLLLLEGDQVAFPGTLFLHVEESLARVELLAFCKHFLYDGTGRLHDDYFLVHLVHEILLAQLHGLLELGVLGVARHLGCIPGRVVEGNSLGEIRLNIISCVFGNTDSVIKCINFEHGGVVYFEEYSIDIFFS